MTRTGARDGRRPEEEAETTDGRAAKGVAAPALAPRPLTPVTPLEPHVIVVFGATGDLARRKLLPGFLHLHHAGLLPRCRIVGVSLDDLDDEAYRQLAYEACTRFARPEALHKHWPTFSRSIRHVPLGDGAATLATTAKEAERELGGGARAGVRDDQAGAAALDAAGDADAPDLGVLQGEERVVEERHQGVEELGLVGRLDRELRAREHEAVTARYRLHLEVAKAVVGAGLPQAPRGQELAGEDPGQGRLLLGVGARSRQRGAGLADCFAHRSWRRSSRRSCRSTSKNVLLS